MIGRDTSRVPALGAFEINLAMVFDPTEQFALSAQPALGVGPVGSDAGVDVFDPGFLLLQPGGKRWIVGG